MDTPGVTRDRIYGKCNYNDKSFLVIDTGGISIGSDDFAKDILMQATLAIDEADLVLFVVDGINDIDASDLKVAEILHKSNKKVIVVVNKIDENMLINSINEEDEYVLYHIHTVGISDSIESITKKYNISVNTLKEYNSFENLELNMKLIIPNEEL